MSKPVTSTVDGRNRSCSTPCPASRRWRTGTGRRVPGVEHVLVLPSACRGSRRPRRGACPPSWRDEDLAARTVPGRGCGGSPELARDAPVLDVAHPLVPGLDPLLGDELHLPASTAAIARPAIERPSAPGLVIAMNHWSVNIGSMTWRCARSAAPSAGASSSRRAGPRRGSATTRLRASKRSSRGRPGRVVVDRRVEREHADHRQAVALADRVSLASCAGVTFTTPVPNSRST